VPTTWQEDGKRLQEVRTEVFVHEQGVPLELELDELDPASRHVLAESDQGQAIGTGRLLPDGHIGRMAVLSDWRGRGVGTAMLTELLEMARAAGLDAVVLNAQTHALGFYARFGFEPQGEAFLDAGLPHLSMRLKLV